MITKVGFYNGGFGIVGRLGDILLPVLVQVAKVLYVTTSIHNIVMYCNYNMLSPD